MLELVLASEETLESSLLSELLLESVEGFEELTMDHSLELLEELELELELLEELSEGWFTGGGLRRPLDADLDCDTVFALDLAAAFLMSLDRLFPAGDRLESASSSELSLEQSIERGILKSTLFLVLIFCSRFCFCFFVSFFLFFFFFCLVVEAASQAAASC